MTPAETISSKFWRWDYPHKNICDGFLFLLVTYNISEKKFLKSFKKSFKSFGKYLRQIVCTGIPLL